MLLRFPGRMCSSVIFTMAICLLQYAASAGLTGCVKLLVQVGFNRKRQREIHFGDGRKPLYYHSILGCFR
jgi:hypothetical protein